jgi:hypothetical protein
MIFRPRGDLSFHLFAIGKGMWVLISKRAHARVSHHSPFKCWLVEKTRVTYPIYKYHRWIKRLNFHAKDVIHTHMYANVPLPVKSCQIPLFFHAIPHFPWKTSKKHQLLAEIHKACPTCSVSIPSPTSSWCAKMDSIPKGHSSNCQGDGTSSCY